MAQNAQLDSGNTLGMKQGKAIYLFVMNSQGLEMVYSIMYLRSISVSQDSIPKTHNDHSIKIESNAIHKPRAFLPHLLDIFL